jgi:excisionase family DNA binding protein
MARRLVGVKEAAAAIGVSPNTIRKWADEGLIPHIRLPGSDYRRFELQALDEFRRSLENQGKELAA